MRGRVRCISLCPFNPSVPLLSSQNGVPRSCAYSVITFPVKLLTNIPNSASSVLRLSQPRSLSLPSTCPPLLWLPTTVPCPLRLSVRGDPLLAKRLDWHIQLAACFIAKSLVYVASDLPNARTQSHHHTRGDPQPACALHHAEQRISVQCARRREQLCADRCRQMDHF